MKHLAVTLVFWFCGSAYIVLAAPDETAAVRAVVQEVFAAERSGKVDLLSKYFLPDFTGFFLNGALRSQGLFIRGLKIAYADGYRQDLNIQHLDVRVYNDTAVATGYLGGSFSFPGPPPQSATSQAESPPRVTIAGPWRASFVLRKQGGAWKIAHFHYSSLAPMPRQALAVHFPEAAVNGIYRPAGQGPFPALVLLHGCSGVEEQQDLWAKILVEWGYTALIVDSLGPRGIEEICTNLDVLSPG